MSPVEQPRVESEAVSEFARVMQTSIPPLSRRPGGQGTRLRACVPSHMQAARGQTKAPRLNLDPGKVKNGLGQLVLTLVKLLHELLERQAIRRIDSGALNDDEIERLGLALMRQAQEIERLRKEFGLAEEDLNLELGPLGRAL